MGWVEEPRALTFRISTVWFIIPHLQAQLGSMGALLLAFAVQLHFLRVLSRTVCTINTYRSRETQKPRRMPGWPDPACVHARTHSWAISGSAPKTLPCAFQLWGPQGKATKSNQALIFTGAQVLRGLSCSVALNLPDFEVMYIESSNKKREPSRTLGTFARSHQPQTGLWALATSLCPWHFLAVTVYIHWAAFPSGPDSLIFRVSSFGWAPLG